MMSTHWNYGEGRFDAGRAYDHRLDSGEAVLLAATPSRVNGLLGMTAADLVYDHGGVTTAQSTESGTSSCRKVVRALLPTEALPSTS
jgi:hypothetical protein